MDQPDPLLPHHHPTPGGPGKRRIATVAAGSFFAVRCSLFRFSLLAFGFSLIAFSCQLSAIGCQPSAFSFQPATGGTGVSPVHPSLSQGARPRPPPASFGSFRFAVSGFR